MSKKNKTKLEKFEGGDKLVTFGFERFESVMNALKSVIFTV